MPAARVNAVLVGAILTGAVCACARTAFAFEEIPRRPPEHRPHRAAYACAIAGVGLIGMSFPLADAADRRYGEYLRETHPDAIASRWDRTVLADRTASGALLAGESLLATAAWLRFIRHPRDARVAFTLGPGQCAVSCSF
jgi:hypothetical protein